MENKLMWLIYYLLILQKKYVQIMFYEYRLYGLQWPYYTLYAK